MALDPDYWETRLAAAQTQLEAVDAAILALVSGGVSSYKLDTGQTSQWVTKQDLDMLRQLAATLENRVSTLDARVNGGRAIYGRPSW